MTTYVIAARVAIKCYLHAELKQIAVDSDGGISVIISS